MVVVLKLYLPLSRKFKLHKLLPKLTLLYNSLTMLVAAGSGTSLHPTVCTSLPYTVHC